MDHAMDEIDLAALANGIIPADEMDDGAASVRAGPRLAERMRAGTNTDLYRRGLEIARELAGRTYGRRLDQIGPREMDELIAILRNEMPGFFKQLRMDVSAMYLSDPDVWGRIGFPGASTQQGGYPDFDRPQMVTTIRVHAKEKMVMATPTPLPAVQAFLSKPGRMLIGGEWREAASGQTIDSLDPATGKPIGNFPAGG